LLLVMLAACAGKPPVIAVADAEPQMALLPAPLPPPSGPMQCVPYARQVSGIDLRGDAWTWWGNAAGRYERGKKPAAGRRAGIPEDRRHAARPSVRGLPHRRRARNPDHPRQLGLDIGHARPGGDRPCA
jgi:hypothetical protein